MAVEIFYVQPGRLIMALKLFNNFTEEGNVLTIDSSVGALHLSAI